MDDLWERASEAETIQEPCNATPRAEARLEVALAIDELLCERLAGRHVGVVFNPRTTNWMEFAFEHLLAHALEERRVQLLKLFVLLSRGSHKAVLRITVHEVNLCRPRARDLLLRDMVRLALALVHVCIYPHRALPTSR